MSSLNQDSNPDQGTLPKYNETASLAPSYKTNDSSGLPQRKELSQKENLAMLEEFRNEQESGKDFEEWHLGANAPGTGLGREPGARIANESSKLLHRVGEMIGGSKSQGEETMKHQK